MGYAPAENDEAEQMHACGIIDPGDRPGRQVAAPGWTAVFSDALIAYAGARRDIVAITAAMPGPPASRRSASATRIASSTSASPSSMP